MDTRTVTGRWLLPDGTPASGHVWFTPTARLVNVADQTVVLPDAVRADLDADGQISVVLPCTDDADLEPAGWMWQVDECLEQAPELQRRWLMVLPYGVGAVDVADVMSRDPLVPGPVWAGPTGPKGEKGDKGDTGATDGRPLVLHPGEDAPANVAGVGAFTLTPAEWVAAVKTAYPHGGTHVYDNEILAVHLTGVGASINAILPTGFGCLDVNGAGWSVMIETSARQWFDSGTDLGGAWGPGKGASRSAIGAGVLQLVGKQAPPNAGDVLTAKDADGNAAWRPIPDPLPDTATADPGSILMLTGPAQGQTTPVWSDNLTAALNRIDNNDQRLNALVPLVTAIEPRLAQHDLMDAVGTGSPEGKRAAPPGARFTQTDHPVGGLVVWRKKTGTGATGWVVTEGDTGWVDVVTFNAAGTITKGQFGSADWGPGAGQAGGIKLRRINNIAFARMLWIEAKKANPTGLIIAWPPGFGDNSTLVVPAPIGSNLTTTLLQPWLAGLLRQNGTIAAGDVYGRYADLTISWPTPDAWPATAP